jgi:O-antigen ligase
LIIAGLIVVPAMGVLVFPRLNTFSQGALASRFQDTEPTGRTEVVRADIEIWKRHPIFGVGPGRAVPLRSQYFKEVAAHTEFSRLLAEHGMLGLAALLVLAAMAGHGMLAWRRRGNWPLGVAAMAWSLLFMLIYGMRLAAPAFLFGLAFVKLAEPAREEPTAERLRPKMRIRVPKPGMPEAVGAAPAPRPGPSTFDRKDGNGV